MPRRRVFDFERVTRPASRRLRRIIARYVVWTEIFGYVFCTLIAIAILVCWFYKVDEVAPEKDIGKTQIKPYEEQVKAEKECVVTNILVKEWQRVKKGDPLLKVCTDPQWVRSYKVRQEWESFAKALRNVEKTGPLAPDVLSQVVENEQRVAAWDAGPRRAGPRTQMKSPMSGEVVGAKDLEGKVIAKDAVLLRVVSLKDLRLAVIFSGTNVERVRVGMPAKLQVQPRYGKNAVARVDTRLNFFKRRRLQLVDEFEDEKLRKLILEWWNGCDLMSREDRRRKIALPATAINEAEIILSARSERLSRAALRRVPRSLRLGVDHLTQMEDLRGTIIGGKHTAVYQTALLTTEGERDLRTYLWKRLGHRGGVLREKNGPEIPVRLTKLQRLRVIVKVKTELPEPNLETLEKELLKEMEPGKNRPKRRPIRSEESGIELGPAILPNWPKQYDKVGALWAGRSERALEAEKTERLFEGTVRLLNPPKEMQDTVRALMKQDPPAYLSAKVQAVVDKRRVALLLFRQ